MEKTITQAWTSPAAVEMTQNAAFSRRVVRLARTSVVALGHILLLWAVTLDTSVIIGVGLALGWVLMPAILWLSLRRPRLRYALVVPSALTSIALLGICLTALPAEPLVRVGWISITCGILFGGMLGMWFWFRWAPVPVQLHDPFSPGRWVLVGSHIVMIAAGIVLVTLAAAGVP